MINCAISKEQQIAFAKQEVAKTLKEKADANESYDVLDHMKKVYNEVLEMSQNNEALALDYARLVPIYADLILAKYPEIKKALREKGLSRDLLDDLTEEVSDPEKGLDNTKKRVAKRKRGGKRKLKGSKSKNNGDETFDEGDGEKEDGTIDPQPPATGETAARKFFKAVTGIINKLKGAFQAVAPTFFSDAGLEAPYNKNVPTEGFTKFAFKVKRDILSQLKSQPDAGFDSTSDKFDYHGYGPIALTAMSITQLEDMDALQDDIDLTKDPNRLGVMLVVTRPDGEPLYFDDNGLPTQDEGKIVYYKLRSTDKYYTNGKFDESKLTKRDKDVLEAKKRYLNQSKKNEDAVKKHYISEIEKIHAIRSTVLKNKDSAQIPLAITGGSMGYIEESISKYRTPLKDVNPDQRLDIMVAKPEDANTNLGLKEGTTYFTADSTHGRHLEVERPVIGYNMISNKTEFDGVEMLTELMVGDVKDEFGNPISFQQRNDLINQFILQRRHRVEILPYQEGEGAGSVLGHYISIFTQEYDITNEEEREEAKQAIKNYFSIVTPRNKVKNPPLNDPARPIVTSLDDPKAKINAVLKVTESGKTTYWKLGQAKLSIMNNILSKNGSIDMPKLAKQADGSMVLTTEPKNYKEFISENFYASAPLNAENKFVALNAYFTFKPTKAAEKMLSPEAATKRNNTTVKEVNQPAKNTPSTESESTQDPNSFFTRARSASSEKNKGLNRLDSTKKDALQATIKQIEEAKVWYENLKWKDSETGEDVYMKDIFPYKQAFKMINTANENAVATWTTAGITLYKGADYSDLYHEAWHAFSQAFMSIDEKKGLYEEVRRKKGTFKTYEGKTKSFADASYMEIEEHLAEEFRSYMLNGQKETKGEPRKNSLFAKIWRFLKTLFNEGTDSYSVILNDQVDKNIKELFDKLRVGDLYNYNFSANNVMFDQLQSGVLALEDRQDSKNQLTNEESQKINDTIDSIFGEFVTIFNSGLSIEEQNELAELEARVGGNYYKKLPRVEAKAKQEADQKRIELLIENRTYTGTRDIVKDDDVRIQAYGYVRYKLKQIHDNYAERYEKEDDVIQKEQLGRDIELLAFTIREFGKKDENGELLSIKEQLPAPGEKLRGVIANHMVKSALFSDAEVVLDFEELTEDQTFLKSRDGVSRKGTENSLKELAKNEIIYLFKTIQKEDKIENYNSFGIRELEEFQAVWNRVARLTQNSLNIDDMYQRMIEEANLYPPIKQILNRLGPMYDENSTKQQMEMWTNFWQTFNKTRIPLIQFTVTRDQQGEGTEYTSTVGEAFNADYAIGKRWNQQLMATREGESKFIKVDEKGPFLDVRAVLKAFPKETIEENAFEFYKAIGFDLTDVSNIRDEIKNKPGLYGATYFRKALEDHVSAKTRAIKGYIPKIREHNNQTGWLKSITNRYKKLQILEARYSDVVSNFMVTNAEGNAQFEHSLNNTLSMTVNAINASNTYDELLEIRHMQDLDIRETIDGKPNPNYNPFAEASIWLRSIYNLDVDPSNPEYGQRRLDANGDLVELQLTNLSGSLLKEKDDSSQQGKSSAKSDEATKAILDLHLSFFGAPELMRHADKGTSYSITIKGDIIGGSRRHYVPAHLFGNASPVAYQQATYKMILPHIIAEMKRMRTMRTMVSDTYDFAYLEAGKQFQLFDDVFDADLLKKLENIVDSGEDIASAIEANVSLRQEMQEGLNDYFENQYNKDSQRYKKYDFATSNMVDQLINEGAAAKSPVVPSRAKEALVRSYVHNNFIHNLESLAIVYGDIALYKHAKEEFHKRNAGAGSTGTIFRTDKSMQNYINNKLWNSSYAKSKGYTQRKYDGTLDTAIVKEQSLKSAYFDKYAAVLGSADAAGAYAKMDEADAQGLITIDAYRELKTAEGDWSDAQELLFKKIVAGKPVTPKDVVEFFPVIKGQYWGSLKHDGKLNIKAFHKYSLMPLIPTLVKGKNAQILHEKMLKEGIGYVTFQSGSKVGTISKKSGPDLLYKENRTLALEDVYDEDGNYVPHFTKNTIHLEYLKNQLNIAPTSKGKIIFSTQLRKLIEDGLMIGGVPIDFMSEEEDLSVRMEAWEEKVKNKKNWTPYYKLLKKYEANIEKLTQYQKDKLLKEMNWTSEIKNGQEVLVGDTKDLINFIRKALTTQDLAEHELDFIDINPRTGKPKYDLSLSLSVEQIEKALNALMVKRLINQKVNGEALVQVASTLFEEMNGAEGYNYTNPTEQDLKKHGSNDLPTYDEGDIIDFNDKYKKQNKDELQDALDKLNARVGDVAYYSESKRKAYQIEVSYLEAKIAGKKPKITTVQDPTKSMKVKVALRGQFKELLNLKDTDGVRIGTIKRLNQLIKDDAWLDMPGKRHREMITMVGVRIPVQGLNSMEFMEVYEFLPEEAGSIIIPPTEIVAKSGADYDVDKMTVMMPNIRKAKIRNGEVVQEPKMWNYNKEELEEAYEFYTEQKKKVARDGMDLRVAQELDNWLTNLVDKETGEAIFGSSEDMEQELLEMLIEEGELVSFEEFSKRMLNDKAIQNDLLMNIKDILSLRDNYETLIRPNGTEIVDVIAKELAPDVRDYNALDVINGERRFIMKDGKKQEIISPTRVLEIGYNMYKHQSNAIGKDTLGLGAVDNTYNALFNRIGFHMNSTASVLSNAEYEGLKESVARGQFEGDALKKAEKQIKEFKRQKLFLPHNQVLDQRNEEAISLSDIYDAEGKYKISDVINQMINGWVDIAKDAWIFDIQGNKEISPTLLFMIQAGVPVKDAVYMASMPLVRKYVEAQKDAKSTVATPLDMAPEDPRWFRAHARRQIFANPEFGFGFSENKLKSVSKTVYAEAERQVNKDVLNKKGHFDSSALRQRIKAEANVRRENKKIIDSGGTDIKLHEYNNLDRAAFLHFLEIEEMAKSVRDIKMKMNVDTSKDKSLFAAQDRIAQIEKLKEDPRIPADFVDKLKKESPISSFYIQDFQIQLLGQVFPLRNHKEVNEFIKDSLNKLSSDQLNQLTKGDPEKFVAEFKNDLALYLLQNEIRGVRLSDIKSYNGYDVKKATIKKVPSLLNGAFVKDNVMYVDPVTLNRDFMTRSFSKQGEMEKRGLAYIPSTAFRTVEEYHKFVLERETLRAQYAPKDLITNTEFNILLGALDSNAKFAQRENETAEQFEQRTIKRAYEEWLRDRALDNSYNYWKMFKSENTYAQQLTTILEKHDDLKAHFSILGNLSIQTTPAGNFKNITLNESKLDSNQIDVAYENFQDLKNKSKLKTILQNKTDEEIDEIVNLFKRLPFVAFLQSGFNTASKYSLVRLVDYKPLMGIVTKATKGFLRHMERREQSMKKAGGKIKSSAVLRDYFTRFKNVNAEKSAKIRGKDYFTGLKFKEGKHGVLTGSYDLGIKSQQSEILTVEKESSTFKQHLRSPKKVGDLVSSKGVKYEITDVTIEKDSNDKAISITYSGVELSEEFDIVRPRSLSAPVTDYSQSATGEAMSKMLEDNPDKIFLYNHAINATSAGTAQDDSRMHNKAGNVFGLPTRMLYNDPAGQERGSIIRDKDGDVDPEIKKEIDTAIAQLVKDSKNKQIVFNNKGYGQDMLQKGRDGNKYAPKTFVYLSQQLLENFDYINPTFLETTSGQRTVQEKQKISDIEIKEVSDQAVLDFINHCNAQ